MATVPLTIRKSRAADAAALAALHAEAWRNAYRGIIPGPALERMILHRGPGWWRDAATARSTLVLEFDARLVGYAGFGPFRGARSGTGEIFELYLEPACQGTGLGRRLFDATAAEIARTGYGGMIVWALAENAAARRFYRAMGGRPWARSVTRAGGAALATVGYLWEPVPRRG